MPDTFTNGKILLTPGNIFHLEKMLQRAGYEQSDMHKLRQPGKLEAILDYLHEVATIEKIDFPFDLDAYPTIDDDDWSCVEHRKQGKFKWDPSKIKLETHYIQWFGGNGHFLQTLWGETAFNATLLDCLKYNRNGRVPQDWIGKKVVAWGSVFWWQESKERTGRYVRYLDCTNGHFYVETKSLDTAFDDTFYAAIRAD